MNSNWPLWRVRLEERIQLQIENAQGESKEDVRLFWDEMINNPSKRRQMILLLAGNVRYRYEHPNCDIPF